MIIEEIKVRSITFNGFDDVLTQWDVKKHQSAQHEERQRIAAHTVKTATDGRTQTHAQTDARLDKALSEQTVAINRKNHEIR